MTYREVETRLLKEGWTLDRQTGSPKIFKHTKNRQIIVLSGHVLSDQVRKGMLAKIRKQAGWK